MTYRILIMGLPGSGKTTLANELQKKFGCYWFNADGVRRIYNDWDFSEEGRLRQAHRMRELADECNDQFAIVDFVAPLPEMREIYDADFTIWMDTIKEGRYEDTNKMFVPPTDFHIRIPVKGDIEKDAEFCYNCINLVRGSNKMSKTRFDMEQEIMGCWNIIEDIKVLHEGVVERDLTTDQISNILLGMQEMYQLKFNILFETFEQSLRKD